METHAGSITNQPIPTFAGLGRIGQGFATDAIKPYQVSINRADNGYIITVGCKTLVSQSLKDVLEGIKLYFENPKEAEKKYLKEKK